MKLPPLFLSGSASWPVPDDAACARLWDKYEMLPNIREHSRTVAHIAVRLAEQAGLCGFRVNVASARAAALLHDLAKTYTIRYGGDHAQLGAAWVREETGNPLLAQCVYFHVGWPWNEGPLAPDANPLRLPLLVAYADKRSRHAQIVTLQERFEDLLVRYGDTPARQAMLLENLRQSRELERALQGRLGDLDIA